uniref:G-protein coupled receptors family 1 profile domain-containing protein n=1 Tax=Strigamia maritima TaxID=126957 RepID=T1J9Y4_STRMM
MATTIEIIAVPIRDAPDIRIRIRYPVIKMLILVILLFLVCWGPRVIMQILIKHGLTFYSPIIYSIRVACMQLPFVHSCLNPIIYSLMSSNFRRMILQSCTKHCSCCCFIDRRRVSSRRGIPSTASTNYELTFNSEVIRGGPGDRPFHLFYNV